MRRRELLKQALSGGAALMAAPALLRLGDSLPQTPSLPINIPDTLQSTPLPLIEVPPSQGLQPSHSIRPPALKEGDTVAIVSPAGGTSLKEMNEGIAYFKSRGCKVVLGKHVHSSNGYLAATDKQRADDFNTFLERDDVAALICSRGGYGVMRILDHINFSLLHTKPKIIAGYSDITALVNAVYLKTGVVAYHAAVASSRYNEFTQAHLDYSFFGKALPSSLPNPTPTNVTGEFGNAPFATITPGTAEGVLIGGNLSLISDLMGTRYQPNFDGAILFLEEIKEEPFRIDRMLTQLLLSDALRGCKGIAIGRFSKCRGADRFTRPSLEAMLMERVSAFGVPAVYGLPFGHVPSKMALPVGIRARLDADNGTLTYLEPPIAS